MRLMRIIDCSGIMRMKKLLGTIETQRDYWGLFRIIESAGNS